ncbi:hypothetical protein A2400_01565 [candidate division WS6 bacterium RIFOXYB1_FULL_33_14]|uniref:Cohesin domain-containing protein n=1 Tax=candidate division WS6 bacterium RIFOXYB1_FULL_33_14 TaxID=1817896 RepID=A0A1F4UH40_9BACT|nr:MAG: hypothetical protein A2400_01565 [candidate division WS6 bacterium RIFOXYB1_FULL_33_14]
MNMKKKGLIFLLFLLLTLSIPKVYAADASFSFYPSSGIVEDVKEGFTVDILIDSGGYELSKARAVIKFDPSVVQLSKAMKNNSLFEEWPLDQSTTDNTNGIVMLTGITSSDGLVPYYKTATSPDVFARLEFDIVDESAEKILLSFEYSGEDELFQSVLISAGKDTQNVLLSVPSSVTFLIDDDIVPSTSIDMNTLGIGIGILLILVGGFVRGSTINFSKQRRGTIVLED